MLTFQRKKRFAPRYPQYQDYYDDSDKDNTDYNDYGHYQHRNYKPQKQPFQTQGSLDRQQPPALRKYRPKGYNQDNGYFARKPYNRFQNIPVGKRTDIKFQ